MTTPTAVKDTGKPARPATDPAGPTGRLATWVAQTTLADVPASVRDRARHLVLDGIACALVGAQLPVSRNGVEGVTALDSAGDAALVGWDGRATSATSAAMLNSSFIQAFELDDYHPLAPLHSNSLVLPAMLAAAPRLGRVSGERFLLGAILGYETGPRVGQALGGLDVLSRGWHSGVVFGPLAAAAAAGTLYGLDPAGFEDAFGMAATQSCGLMSAMYESMVKRMQHGFASRNGLTAAALAASGYVGIKRVFERPYGGWLAVFGEGHRTYSEDISKGLGTLWETERIAVKPYSAMGLLHAAIDAALELRPNVDVSQIQRIDIDMGEAAYAHGGWKAERPLQVIGAQMNVAYVVAVAILDGDVLVGQFSPDWINRDDVWALIDRTLTHHERAYDNLPIDERLTTRVRLTFNDGSTRAAEVVHPRGTGDRNLTNADIRDKYAKLTHRAISAERQAAIEKAVLGIDALDDIAQLAALLTPAVRSPLD
ncbi:MmgE/PrpD family protein [Kribbella qitaiheensis]|uniref:MmgE/PrpD family protein n=1 Tax=Kribbella qitaiheensis TaxID=1544730 RepID=UPI003613143B